MIKKAPFLLLLLLLPFAAQANPEQGMVVAADQRAAAAGIGMFLEGGNAFDAAAATALALGVVEPGSSGLGGGGFFLLYIAKEDRYVMLDARETSPRLAGNGEVYRNRSSVDGPQSAAVPGLAAAVEHLTGQYGNLKRQQVASPAIELARSGFAVTPRLRRLLDWRSKVFNDSARNIFLTGQTIEQRAVAVRAVADDPLLGLGQHTYSHQVLKSVYPQPADGQPYKPGKALGFFLEGADLATIEQEIGRTQDIFEKTFGRPCEGLTAPWGHYRGLCAMQWLTALLHNLSWSLACRGIRSSQDTLNCNRCLKRN